MFVPSEETIVPSERLVIPSEGAFVSSENLKFLRRVIEAPGDWGEMARAKNSFVPVADLAVYNLKKKRHLAGGFKDGGERGFYVML